MSIKRGDIVRLATATINADFALKFKIVDSEDMIEHSAIGLKTGLVLYNHQNANPEMYLPSYLTVAFGDTVIVAYKDYFEKV